MSPEFRCVARGAYFRSREEAEGARVALEVALINAGHAGRPVSVVPVSGLGYAVEIRVRESQ